MAVEFALLLPLLVVLLFGILQGGVYFHQRNGLNAAAREGARVAAIRVSTSVDPTYDPAAAVSKIVAQALSGVINGSRYQMSISPTNACQSVDTKRVSVTVSAPLDWNMPFVPSPASSLSATGTFRCE